MSASCTNAGWTNIHNRLNRKCTNPIYYWRKLICSVTLLFLAYEKSSSIRSKKEYSPIGQTSGEKILEIPWLGVIFKPKRSIDLRRRLGPVADLLEEAKTTGRCYIYEDSGRYTSSTPPILAGLSADICSHGHLAAGSAAL